MYVEKLIIKAAWRTFLYLIRVLCPSIGNNPVPWAVERDTTVLGVFLCDLQISMSIFVCLTIFYLCL